MKHQLPADLKIGDRIDHVALVRQAIDIEQLNAGATRSYIVMPEPGCDHAVVDRLGDMKLKPYVPVIHKEVRLGRGRKRVREVPMFAGYVFVPLVLTDLMRRIVREVRGVDDFLMIDGKIPASVPETDQVAKPYEISIEKIRKVEAKADRAYQQHLLTKGASRFTIGKEVWAEIMPFRSMLATIRSIDKRGRIEVELDENVFGRKVWPIEQHRLRLAD